MFGTIKVIMQSTNYCDFQRSISLRWMPQKRTENFQEGQQGHSYSEITLCTKYRSQAMQEQPCLPRRPPALKLLTEELPLMGAQQC